MSLTHESVAHLLPAWIELEFDYANAKYGGDNPQTYAWDNGLYAGGKCYMDFLNYINKFRIFLPEKDAHPRIALMASQAVLKFVNVGTAQLVVHAQKRNSCENMLEAYQRDVSPWLAQALPALEPTEIRDPLLYAVDTLHASLIDLADTVNTGSALDAEEKARRLMLANAQFALSHIVELGVMAAPGYTSGEVYSWE
jgi:hypothetical protein